MKTATVALSLVLLGLTTPVLAQYKYQGIQTPPQRTSQPGYQPQNYPTPNVRGGESTSTPYRLGSPTTTQGSGNGITAGQRSSPSMMGTRNPSSPSSPSAPIDRSAPSSPSYSR